MSDADATTPRVFIARYGETEVDHQRPLHRQCRDCSHAKRHRSSARNRRIARRLQMLIDPSKLAHVFTSPRQRAIVTLDMLIGPEQKKRLEDENRISVTEDITEWDYGAYEGLTPKEIKESRASRGLPKWDIWTEGCESGESAEAVQERLDRLIGEIYKLQAPHMDGNSGHPADILVVAHGHILRAFVKRWLLYPMALQFTMMMEPGAIGIMSYAHHNIEEPAILVGMAFPQDK